LRILSQLADFQEFQPKDCIALFKALLSRAHQLYGREEGPSYTFKKFNE
jgi:hypothetical protein